MNSLYTSYANALFSLQEENNKSTSDTIKTLETIYASFDDEIKKFLYSKAIKSSDKKEVIKNALKGIDKNIVSFIYVLIDNGRINEFENIIKALKLKEQEKSAKVEVDVVTATKLDQDTLAKIKKIVKEKFFDNNLDKEIIINEIIDKEVLQGIIIKYQNKVLDASILGKKLSLKEYLEK